MDIDLADLPDNVETLQRMVRTLATERANLTEAQAEIERLRLIVQKLQRSQFGRRAERLDDDQLQFGFEDLHADIARVEATLRSTTVKTPRSRPDRPSLPAHLPREDMRLDLEHQACPCCGGELHVIGETVSEMLDHVPARLRVIRRRASNGGVVAYPDTAIHVVLNNLNTPKPANDRWLTSSEPAFPLHADAGSPGSTR
jgi:transposase